MLRTASGENIQVVTSIERAEGKDFRELTLWVGYRQTGVSSEDRAAIVAKVVETAAGGGFKSLRLLGDGMPAEPIDLTTPR